eukprot:767141-Hanusia_phi.AAC.17
MASLEKDEDREDFQRAWSMHEWCRAVMRSDTVDPEDQQLYKETIECTAGMIRSFIDRCRRQLEDRNNPEPPTSPSPVRQDIHETNDL